MRKIGIECLVGGLLLTEVLVGCTHTEIKPTQSAAILTKSPEPDVTPVKSSVLTPKKESGLKLTGLDYNPFLGKPVVERQFSVAHIGFNITTPRYALMVYQEQVHNLIRLCGVDNNSSPLTISFIDQFSTEPNEPRINLDDLNSQSESLLKSSFDVAHTEQAIALKNLKYLLLNSILTRNLCLYGKLTDEEIVDTATLVFNEMLSGQRAPAILAIPIPLTN